MTVRCKGVSEAFDLDALTTQQQATIAAANVAQQSIPDCMATVLLSFVRKPGGGYLIEVGVAGHGPRGFGSQVGDTLRAAADPVRVAMTKQEGSWT